ncbi:MAG: hypothetical protein M3094_07590, partial [Actinomycetia bacterium]|nr:hypothetical protein [Actinomycetes bacterium]
MNEHIAYLFSLGGLVSDSVLAELRSDTPQGPAKKLTDPTTFELEEGAAPSRRQLEEDIELTYRTTEAAWNVLAAQLGELDVSRLRERLLLPLLRDLGFDPQYQQAHLFGDDGRRYAISHLGWDGPNAPPMILTGDDLDHREGRARSPHQELQAYLNAVPARWGIVANGQELRILRDFHHTTTQGAIVVSIADLIEAGSFADFRSFYRLAHASRFTRLAAETDVDADSRLEQLYLDSLSEGIKVGDALQPQVRKALVTLLNGFLAGDTGLRRRLDEEPEFGRQLYGELLTVLYRILFLLFAEQRGLLIGANEVYRDSYAVTRLRDLAETRSPEPRRKDLWEGLKATFLAFSGDERLASVLGVHPYNGHLFESEGTPHLSAATATNEQILDAFRALTTVEIGHVRQYVDYRHLGVEELGSVYESLLNYTIRIAIEPVTVDGVAFQTGQAYLAPLSIERSELGAY